MIQHKDSNVKIIVIFVCKGTGA